MLLGTRHSLFSTNISCLVYFCFPPPAVSSIVQPGCFQTLGALSCLFLFLDVFSRPTQLYQLLVFLLFVILSSIWLWSCVCYVALVLIPLAGEALGDSTDANQTRCPLRHVLPSPTRRLEISKLYPITPTLALLPCRNAVQITPPVHQPWLATNQRLFTNILCSFINCCCITTSQRPLVNFYACILNMSSPWTPQLPNFPRPPFFPFDCAFWHCTDFGR